MIINLSREEMQKNFASWLIAWDNYDLEGVLDWMHDDVVFENWDGKVVTGKSDLQKAWLPWFIFNGNFKFYNEDVFIDEEKQKLSFQWRLEWPSPEKNYKGLPEIRRGVDVIHFLQGKIIKKYSFSKTIIQIDNKLVLLTASN